MKILVFIVVVAILSVMTTVSVAAMSFPQTFNRGLTFTAEELSEKPDDYISLKDPDPYVLYAITHPGERVVVGSWDNSEFDDMVAAYGTKNVEIDGKYYYIQVLSGESFFPGLFLLSIAGWIGLGIAKVVIRL